MFVISVKIFRIYTFKEKLGVSARRYSTDLLEYYQKEINWYIFFTSEFIVWLVVYIARKSSNSPFPGFLAVPIIIRFLVQFGLVVYTFTRKDF